MSTCSSLPGSLEPAFRVAASLENRWAEDFGFSVLEATQLCEKPAATSGKDAASARYIYTRLEKLQPQSSSNQQFGMAKTTCCQDHTHHLPSF